MNRTYSLADLGWAADFLRQLALDEIGTATPCRISAVHRDRLETLSEAGPLSLTLPPGHSTAGIGCTACHNPHNQQALFEDPDQLCINCHSEDMERYLEDLHVQKDIGCVDCHALVIPPEEQPLDGIVPTGHTFTITPQTCIACHTDALHAGFSLPGYEAGATSALNGSASAEPTPAITDDLIDDKYTQAQTGLSAEQRLQALEASMASQQLSTLFQGGVIGLVLGGTTAWFMAFNARSARQREENNGSKE